MSEALAKLAKLRRPQEKEKPLHADEQKALKKLQDEAKAAGATLATGGKGGLPPSHVLGIMRRDEFKCKKCGTQKMLSVHHKGHLKNPVSRWLKKKGSDDSENNTVTICADCHDDIHQEDNKQSQQKPQKQE